MYRNGWAQLSDSQRVREALDLLVDYGHLGPVTVETTGRPATHYQIIP